MKTKLVPYYREIGYELGRDGLFHKQYVTAKGTPVHLIEVDAERFHRIRRHNLRACGVEVGHATSRRY